MKNLPIRNALLASNASLARNTSHSETGERRSNASRHSKTGRPAPIASQSDAGEMQKIISLCKKTSCAFK